jgi:hypothetical protein
MSFETMTTFHLIPQASGTGSQTTSYVSGSADQTGTTLVGFGAQPALAIRRT